MTTPSLTDTLRRPDQAGSPQRKALGTPHSKHGVGWRIWTLSAALFFTYMLLSLRIHAQMQSHSYDLAIFEQAVRSYAHGRLPVSEVKGPDYPVLGDHFSPVLALLAPFYILWPTAKTLLVAQAALMAASVVPLALWTRRALGNTASLAVGTAYGLSFGIASAIGYDFHEWAFGAPLLACSLAALGQGRLRAASWWALPLLLVKEDMGMAVCAIGLLIARHGERKRGLVTAGIGLAAALVTVLVIIPAFNINGEYTHWFGMDQAGGAASALGQSLYNVTTSFFTPMEKADTLLLSLSVTLFLALRSPIILVAVPTFLWRFGADYPPAWGTGFQYSMLVMTIFFAAFIDALVKHRSGRPRVRRYLIGITGVTLLLLPQFPLWQLTQPATWHDDSRVSIARLLMRRIPDNATVQASTLLVPQLSSRTKVSLFGWPASRPNPDYILVDTLVPPGLRWPQTIAQERNALNTARAQGYTTVADVYGFIMLHRQH
ncbi:DUF2079 domain-containing protein [Streptomyces sp. NPDC055085]